MINVAPFELHRLFMSARRTALSKYPQTPQHNDPSCPLSEKHSNCAFLVKMPKKLKVSGQQSPQGGLCAVLP